MGGEVDLGALAEKFDGEDSNWWIVQGENKVIAVRGSTLIAEIEFLEGTRCHLTIPNWSGLIRTEHLGDYYAANTGLIENTSEDVLFGEKFPDSEGIVDFGEPKGLDYPPHPIVKRTRHRAPRVVM